MGAAAIFGIVLLGACIQRVSGMGLGLVAAPILAVLLGPVEGILVSNVLAVINASMTTVVRRRDVDWRQFALISPVLVVGAVPAAWLPTVADTPVLLASVGVLMLCALGLSTFGQSHIPPVRTRAAPLIAGLAAGFMNTLAAIAAPALTVYAQATRWEQRSFSATLQPIFLVAGIVSVAVKVLGGAADLNNTDVWVWPAGIGGMICGIILGSLLSTRIPTSTARRVALTIATAGAVVVLVRGISGLIG